MILFRLAILNNNDVIARVQAGGALERDLIELISKSVSDKVGFVTTRSKVKSAISEGLTEAIKELKMKTTKIT